MVDNLEEFDRERSMQLIRKHRREIKALKTRIKELEEALQIAQGGIDILTDQMEGKNMFFMDSEEIITDKENGREAPFKPLRYTLKPPKTRNR